MNRITFCIAFLALFALGLESHAQPFALDTVIPIEGASKQMLMLNAKSVLVDYFKDASEVIQLIDEENGVIMGKGNYSYTFPRPRFTCTVGNGAGTVSFTIKLLFKDEKVRIMLYDFIHKSNDPNINFGLITLNTLSYQLDGAFSVALNKCREEIYYDIIKKNQALFNGFAQKIAVSKIDNSTDW